MSETAPAPAPEPVDVEGDDTVETEAVEVEEPADTEAELGGRDPSEYVDEAPAPNVGELDDDEATDEAVEDDATEG